MTDAADNDDERAEELRALTAIFPELVIDSSNPFAATLELEVAPHKPLITRFIPDEPVAAQQDTYASALANARAHIEHDVALSHLPPLLIEIDLPQGYPTEKPPTVSLRSAQDWLPTDLIATLQERAASLWDDYGRDQVLFAYIDYLQQTAEVGFDLDQSADGCLKLGASKEDALVVFDAAATLAIFRKGTYDCEICLEPKKGSSCYRMDHCGHVFCLQCLQDFYNNAITEGDVVNVKCLSPACGKEGKQETRKPNRTLHPRELLAMGIEEAKVRRYLEIKRKKKLESDPSTIYCPRTWCQEPARTLKYPKIPQNLSDYVENEDTEILPTDTEDTPPEEGRKIPSNPADRLAICEKCSFAFCSVCYMGWHGALQRCTPRDPNELSPEEQASYEYIRLNTSPCPTCCSPTQKTMGCNHMKCFQCNSHFCYLCGAWLMANNPYRHFNTPGIPCYQRLWELEEGTDGPPPGNDGGHVAAGEVAPREEHGEAAGQRNNHAAAPPVAEVAAQAARDHAEREAEELRLFALVEQDDASDEEIEDHLQQMDINADRRRRRHVRQNPANQQRGRGEGVGNDNGRQARMPAPRGQNDAVRAHVAEVLPDRNAQRLQRFLDLAARDVEDEWDSDELGDEGDYVIH